MCCGCCAVHEEAGRDYRSGNQAAPIWSCLIASWAGLCRVRQVVEDTAMSSLLTVPLRTGHWPHKSLIDGRLAFVIASHIVHHAEALN